MRHYIHHTSWFQMSENVSKPGIERRSSGLTMRTLYQVSYPGRLWPTEFTKLQGLID